MKKIALFCSASLLVAAFSCQNNETKQEETKKTNISIGKVADVAVEQSQIISKLETAQSTTASPDSMFLYDSIIGAAKVTALKKVGDEFATLKAPIDLPFSQTANSDKIRIVSVCITGVKDLNELLIEADIEALASSAYDMPYAGLTAADTAGVKLDIGGGIGANSKLVAGQKYTFKGSIYNYKLLNNAQIILFDEEFKKW